MGDDGPGVGADVLCWLSWCGGVLGEGRVGWGDSRAGKVVGGVVPGIEIPGLSVFGVNGGSGCRPGGVWGGMSLWLRAGKSWGCRLGMGRGGWGGGDWECC